MEERKIPCKPGRQGTKGKRIGGRKSVEVANKTREGMDFETWQLLIRNPDFIGDLKRWRKKLDSTKGRIKDRIIDEDRKFCDKWGLLRLPYPARRLALSYDLDDPRSLESAYKNRQILFSDIPFIIRRSVELLELKDGNYLHFWADVTRSQAQILAEFEGCLKEYFQPRHKQKRERGRPSNFKFQMRVYDLVTKFCKENAVKDLQRVALKLRTSTSPIPVSRVRDAYWAACHKIGVEGIKGRPDLKDPGDFATCSDLTCREAQKFNGLNDLDEAKRKLCSKHRIFYCNLFKSRPKSSLP